MTEEQLRNGRPSVASIRKLMPGEEEVAENPRARSSVLRIAGEDERMISRVTETLSKS